MPRGSWDSFLATLIWSSCSYSPPSAFSDLGNYPDAVVDAVVCHHQRGTQHSVRQPLSAGCWWLTAGSLLQPFPVLKGTSSWQGYASSLRVAHIHCLVDKGVQKYDPFASIWDISEGPSQFWTSLWAQMRSVLQPHLSLPSPSAHSCFPHFFIGCTRGHGHLCLRVGASAKADALNLKEPQWPGYTVSYLLNLD